MGQRRRTKGRHQAVIRILPYSGELFVDPIETSVLSKKLRVLLVRVKREFAMVFGTMVVASRVPANLNMLLLILVHSELKKLENWKERD